jgi:hypothetical protein
VRIASADDTLDASEAAGVQFFYHKYIIPLLRPHQKLWIVPGIFGPSAYRGNATALAAQDAMLVAKLAGWLDWARTEPLVVGMMPWHWQNCPTGAAPGIMLLGVSSFPRTMQAFAQLRAAMKTDDETKRSPATQQHQQQQQVAYIVESRTDEQPILAYTGFAAGPQNSDWQQVFNPTWVQASPATGNRAGLLVRSQNCTPPAGSCGGDDGGGTSCAGTGQNASWLTWAELRDDSGAASKPSIVNHVTAADAVCRAKGSGAHSMKTI